MKIFSTSLAVVILVTSVGCYTSREVPPAELYKLNGYREGQTIYLADKEGESVKFSSKTDLRVESDDGQHMNARFSAIDVNGTTMTAVVRSSGAPVNIELSRVVAAEAKNMSIGKSVGLGVGLGVGLPIVIGITAFVILVAASSSATHH
jgi:hypothetical protein